MEEGNLLETTKRRLRALKGISKLQRLSVQAIVKLIMAEQPQIPLENNINLTQVCKELILQELLVAVGKEPVNQSKLLIRALPALISTSTEVLDLSSLDRIDSDTLHGLMQTFSGVCRTAKNLRQLTINNAVFQEFYCGSWRNTFVSHLSSLKNLHVLKFVGPSRERADMTFLCSQLASLRVLSKPDFHWDDLLSDDELRQSFGRLRLLECSDPLAIVRRFRDALPQLDVVRDIQRFGISYVDFLGERRFRQCLLIDRTLQHIPEREEPHIRHLEINIYNAERQGESNVPALIESMTLNEVEQMTLPKNVTVGPFSELRRLNIIGNAGINVKISDASLCARLEELHVTSASFQADKPVHNLRALSVCANHSSTLRILSLHRTLLSAPKLETLRMHRLDFSLTDLQSVTNSIITGEILLDLKTLSIRLHEHTRQEVLREIASIVKNAAAHIPGLTVLKFDNGRPGRHNDENLNRIVQYFV